ncbi:MAG: hypothetical protein V7754_00755 [Halioglobus sp.]
MAAPWLLWLLFLAVTVWVYAPGIAGPALLDDRASVMVMDELNEHPEYALDYILGDTSGPLGRPVSMVSFVLEKLYLDEGISGGKKVNIALHLVNGSLVVWLFTYLLAYVRAPAYRWLAVTLGATWLLSPLYVSTVLYVVQRMAMLGALFMLAACVSYAGWRMALVRGETGRWQLPLVLVFLILAVFAKENSIVVLPILLLMEALWFGFRGEGGRPIIWLRRTSLGMIFLGTLFLATFFTVNADWLVNSYGNMPFNLQERVLTESNILWEYVGQLYSPDVTGMGLYHDDVIVAKSLTDPRGTLGSVVAWLGFFLLCLVLLRWQRGRYFVFACSIFVVGHLTESTILPLELYFEHRNYFPGIGLFLLLGLPLVAILKKWPEPTAPLLVCLGLYVLTLVLQTSSQVQLWSNGPLLKLNNVNAHPESYRANTDMGAELAQAGELVAALEYSARAHRARPSEREGDHDIRDLALSCLANKPLPDERVVLIGTVHAERPLSSVSTLQVLVRLLQGDTCPEFDRVGFANRMKQVFLEEGHDDKAANQIYSRLAVLESSLERYDNAYVYIEKFLNVSPDDVTGLLMKLHFSTALDLATEVSATIARLQALNENEKLTVSEQQTLSLYLEN